MTADSIVIRRRLNVSLGAHSLLCIPTELTNHVCATLQGQQAEPGACSLLKNWASDGWFVSFEEPIPPSDTTCVMVTRKNASQRSFTDSTEKQSSHTAVKYSQMSAEAGLSQSDRRCSSNASVDDDTIWQANKTTPGRAETKWDLIRIRTLWAAKHLRFK